MTEKQRILDSGIAKEKKSSMIDLDRNDLAEGGSRDKRKDS
jgi:hypothetical protein